MDLGRSQATPNAGSTGQRATPRSRGLRFVAATLFTLHAVLPASIGVDQAGIDRKPSMPTGPLADAAALDVFEQPSQQITVAEAAMSVFEKVEWSGTSPSSPRWQNRRYARLR